MKRVDLTKVVEQYKELCVGAHIVRYKTVKSNRFDTTAFKKEHANMYADFLKESTSRRFTIA